MCNHQPCARAGCVLACQLDAAAPLARHPSSSPNPEAGPRLHTHAVVSAPCHAAFRATAAHRQHQHRHKRQRRPRVWRDPRLQIAGMPHLPHPPNSNATLTPALRDASASHDLPQPQPHLHGTPASPPPGAPAPALQRHRGPSTSHVANRCCTCAPSVPHCRSPYWSPLPRLPRVPTLQVRLITLFAGSSMNGSPNCLRPPQSSASACTPLASLGLVQFGLVLPAPTPSPPLPTAHHIRPHHAHARTRHTPPHSPSAAGGRAWLVVHHRPLGVLGDTTPRRVG